MASSPLHACRRVRFGEFQLDFSTRELWTNGSKQRLAPQPFQLLQLLLDARGGLVTRDTLFKQLWPSGTFVDYEQGLKKAINRLREALHDSAEQPRFIETIPRLGYRFIGDLHFEESDSAADPRALIRAPVPNTEFAISGNRITRLDSFRLAVFALALIAVAGFVLWRATRFKPLAVFEPQTTQLTANSLDNPISSGSISPDGKYLAFTDSTSGMKIRLLRTGETQTIPEPDLPGVGVDWAIAGWFPDSSGFIANARSLGTTAIFPLRYRFTANSSAAVSTQVPAGRTMSIWVVSILGKTPQKLRDNSDAFSVSPDGSLISFGTNLGEVGDREIWLMDPKGQHATKLCEAPSDRAIGGLKWSWDGLRVMYFKVGVSGGELVSRDLRGGAEKTLLHFADWWSVTDFVPLPNARLIYAAGGNLWQMKMDSHSGDAVGQPRQLTNWDGSIDHGGIGEMSATSDGRRIALQRWASQTTISIADMRANGTLASSPQHFTFNEHSNVAETWTPDSRAIVFRSRRTGRIRLFRQALGSATEESLLLGAENVGGSTISPDGSWLLYLNCGEQPTPNCDAVVPLMRVAIRGGEPSEVLRSNTYGRPRCAFFPASICVIAEQNADGEPVAFISFDPVKGRGALLATFLTEPACSYSWGLSPDGSHVAILKNWDDRIRVISLKGDKPQEVRVQGTPRLTGIYWAADGKGWFTESKHAGGVVLLHVNLRGEMNSLWQLNGGTAVYGLPSPDGRHLAIVSTAQNNNIWTAESF